VDKRSTSAGNVQKGDSLGDSPGPHWDLALSAKVTTGDLNAPHLQVEGRVLPPMDRWVLGPPGQAPLLDINVEAIRVTIIVEKWKVIFILDSGAHFCVLPFSPGSWSNNKVIILGISGQPLEHYFTWPLASSWGDLHFCHSFLMVPKTLVPLLA
jgi:hypothetical protein